MQRFIATLRRLSLHGMVLIVCFWLPALQAAQGYVYEAIYVDGQFANQDVWYGHGGINDDGTIVFMTREQESFSSVIWRLYVVEPGLLPQLVIESRQTNAVPPNSDPILKHNNPIGINNDGIVVAQLDWPIFDEEQTFIGYECGYGWFEPGVGLIREIRGSGYCKAFRGPNSILEIGGGLGVSGSGFQLRVTDGITISDSGVEQPQTCRTGPVNDSGTIAGQRYSADDRTEIQWATPPGPVSSVDIGSRLGLGYISNCVSPGLNNRGWITIATNNDNSNRNPNPRVLVIKPDESVATVVDVAGTEFTNFGIPRRSFYNAPAINDFNRVAFVGELSDTGVPDQGIYVADLSGDGPQLAVPEVVNFVDGRTLNMGQFLNDVTHFGSTSYNDAGEIVMVGFGQLVDAQGVQLQSQANVLFVARPKGGGEPGNSILPESEDFLPDGGWRLRGRCWRDSVADIPGSCAEFGGIEGETPRTWYDPPIAVGYDYRIDDESTGAFTSVLIPVPLPGGDAEFELEVNGAPAVLMAGEAFDFSSVTPDPVRSFRIAGIDQAENLDPEDWTAFITGLTFAPGTHEDVSFTMVPVVFDPADADLDGVPDRYDDFPNDPTRSGDTDGDGIDDNVDTDDDGDGLADADDDYPWGRFDDAGPGHWAFAFVEALARAGITVGCSGDDYCPSDPVTRAQMAVFIERAINGPSYSPPSATGTVFGDVAAEDFAAAFIEQLFADGITVGCGGGNYCPTAQVSRSQMAVFLLRAKYGTSYVPPEASGTFADVPGDYWAVDWIEQLAVEEITAGCGEGNFCPETAVTRDQMAVFLVRTFGL